MGERPLCGPQLPGRAGARGVVIGAARGGRDGRGGGGGGSSGRARRAVGATGGAGGGLARPARPARGRSAAGGGVAETRRGAGGAGPRGWSTEPGSAAGATARVSVGRRSREAGGRDGTRDAGPPARSRQWSGPEGRGARTAGTRCARARSSTARRADGCVSGHSHRGGRPPRAGVWAAAARARRRERSSC